MARSFNGSSDRGQASKNLSPYSVVAASLWVYPTTWATSAGQYNMMLELTTDGLGTAGGFNFYNSGSASEQLTVSYRGSSSGQCNYVYGTRPATGAWAHYLVVWDLANKISLYQNGTLLTPTSKPLDSVGTGTFANSTLNVGSRNGSSLYYAGRKAEVALWSTNPGSDGALQLAAGVSPASVRPQSLVAYWPLIGRASPEPDLRGGFNLTLTGTAQADHPRVYYPGRRRTVFVPGAGGGTVVSGYGTAAGVNLTTAESQARFATFGAAGGSNSGVGEGRSRHQSAGTAAGTASVVGVSAARVEAVGAAAGSNVSTGVGRIRKAGSGVAAGTNSATGASQARAALIGAAAGTNDTDAVSRALWEASGSADGTNTATGYIIDGNAPPTWMRNLQILKKGVS